MYQPGQSQKCTKAREQDPKRYTTAASRARYNQDFCATYPADCSPLASPRLPPTPPPPCRPLFGPRNPRGSFFPPQIFGEGGGSVKAGVSARSECGRRKKAWRRAGEERAGERDDKYINKYGNRNPVRSRSAQKLWPAARERGPRQSEAGGLDSGPDPIFPSGCEGKLGVALESLQGLRDLT